MERNQLTINYDKTCMQPLIWGIASATHMSTAGHDFKTLALFDRGFESGCLRRTPGGVVLVI